MSVMPAPADLRILRRSLHDEVTDRLRSLIIEGEVEPGMRLNERVLCERLDVSRTPLREAFKVLAVEGLLDLLPNRGAKVAPLSVAELDQTIEVMAALERLAGRLVVDRLTPERLAELQGLHYEMLAHHARGQLPGYFRCNQAIHFAIMAGTGNRVLERQYAMPNARIRRYRYIANLSRERWDRSVAEHEEILARLTAGDGPGLADILARHLYNKLAHVKAGLAASADAAACTTMEPG
jgi:DNA-binding GntR family transcriptional regulator